MTCWLARASSTQSPAEPMPAFGTKLRVTSLATLSTSARDPCFFASWISCRQLLLLFAARKRCSSDLDAARLGLLQLGDLDREHSIGEIGGELLFVEVLGQRERSRERAVGTA